MQKTRCTWCGTTDQLYIDYHDHEWGVPVHDDRRLFEFLILEGAQAGLSWITVLRKREDYSRLFHGWDIEKISEMTDTELEEILLDATIIRNRLKIYSMRKNALATLQIQQEFGSLDAYFWNVQWFRRAEVRIIQEREALDPSYRQDDDRKFPIIHHGAALSDFPTEDSISQAISKDLKKRGMTFIGPTIIYAYMQAIGIVDDHIDGCYKKSQ